MYDLQFPADFLWGVATSAFQIEGGADADGKGPSIWDTFSRTPGRVFADIPGDVTCDSYHRLDEDLAALRALGVGSYRFSISWPRVLPQGTGAVNRAGLDYYRRLVEGLLAIGVTPNATLYHWDLPQALQDRGGWCNRDVADWFADYASIVFDALGDIVPMWSTLNEPIALWVGYGMSTFAPGLGDPKAGKAAMHHGLLAHGKAVSAFRAGGHRGDIGIVVDLWKRHPRTDSPSDLALARDGDENSFGFFLGPIYRGRYSDYILESMDRAGTMPDIRDGDLGLISAPLDYHGLNVYNRVVVSAEDDGDHQFTPVDPERPVGGNYLDNGEELYARSIYDALRILRRDFGVSIPIYITENGTRTGHESAAAGVVTDGIVGSLPDPVQDHERIRYTRAFLTWLHRAMAEGADVRGYYHWSLMDNYEWAAGFSSPMGLLRTDPVTLDRTFKASAHWYREVATTGRVEAADE